MRKQVVLLTLIVLLGGMLVVSWSFAQHPTRPSCLQEWGRLSDQEQAACADSVGGLNALKATDDASQSATAMARPTWPPMAGLATETAWIATRGMPTSLPKGYIPPAYQRIQEIPRLKRQGWRKSGLSYRHGASVWQLGGVADSYGESHVLYAYTWRGECFLGTTVGDYEGDVQRYEKWWRCPPDHDLGELRITAATGITGTLSFTNALSQTGSFDLATETWTFDP